MEDKKHVCEQETKKTSKRYLAFYIIALFSVALVIILLSYLTQLRADRALANMNDVLAQKDTTVQGTQQKMLVLQDTVAQQGKQLEAIQSQVDALRKTVNAGEGDDLTAVVQQRMDEHDAYQHLLKLTAAAEQGSTMVMQAEITYLEQTYGAGRLDGTAENAVFTGEMAEQYLALKAKA